MLTHISLTNVLCLDIETVPQFESFDHAPAQAQLLWKHKSGFMKQDQETPASLYHRAGIYSEFGKVVCISAGYLSNYNGREFILQSFYGDDEKKILEDFISFLNSLSIDVLCAHNGKEFDFPYLSRRMLINGLRLPDLLQLAGKKPWEVYHLDTLDLWKFGDHKHYTPLNLLAYVLNIPTPKDDIDGSMVHEVYWKQKDLERIAVYCEKDVITVIQILLKMKGLNALEMEEITSELN